MTQPGAGVPATYRKLSVIVPVYNERNTVVEILRRMRAVDLPLDREFVIVDDGSTDGTRDVLRQLADSTVRVITHEVNRGKGAAIRSGLAHLTGDLVFEPLPADDPKQRRPDISLAERVLGWHPRVDLREGLARTHDSYRRLGGT